LLVKFNNISSVVYKVIPGLLQLYNEIVVLPPNKALYEILELFKYNTLLDYISVINSIHLPVVIKGGKNT
jgi:hypothetical protein